MVWFTCTLSQCNANAVESGFLSGDWKAVGMARKRRQASKQTNIPARIDNLQGGCVVVGIDF